MPALPLARGIGLLRRLARVPFVYHEESHGMRLSLAFQLNKDHLVPPGVVNGIAGTPALMDASTQFRFVYMIIDIFVYTHVQELV